MKSPLLLATLAALVLGAAPLTAQAEEAAPAAPAAAAPAAAPAASNTNRTVAFVDLQKALNNCTEGKEAKKRLEADFDWPGTKPPARLPFQFECANEACGALQLVERQQPQRVAHDD